MKKSYLRLLSVMLFACICSGVFAAKTTYGFVLSSLASEKVGFYSFDADKPSDGTTLIQDYKSTGKPQAAAFADGSYYFIGRASGAAIALQKTDLKAEAYEIIGESILGISFKDMTYDATTGTMYAVGKAGLASNLYKINLATGACTVVAALASEQVTIACSEEGQLYSLSSAGELNKLNKETAALEKIAKVNVTFDAFGAQSMEFDKASNTLYWSYTSNDFSKGFISVVNLSTASVTASEFKNAESVIGLYIESKPATKWHGYSMFANSYADFQWGMVNFSPDDLSKVNFVKSTGLVICSAVFADGTYYAVTFSPGLGAITKVNNLITLDIETGDVKNSIKLENTPFLHDMTYDYSTNTVYAISFEVELNHSNLWKLNGDKFEKVVELGYEYRALAATLEGGLYAITDKGILHKLNKVNGTAQVIGSTGISFDTTVPCTMEFDHNSELLYFTCLTKKNEIFDANKSILVNLSTEDGSIVKSDIFAERDQILGLYIPFERSNTVPASVSDFMVTPAANGELKATLKWKNPSLTAGGSALSSIEKVEIIRDDKEVASLSDQTPGGEVTWTDNAPVNGFNSYVIKVYNNKGAGEAVSSLLFIGKDVPGKPGNVKLAVKDATKVTLTWEVPAVSMNTGWFDKANVKYNVMRLPDSTKVATGLSALKFEEELTTMSYYSYVVTANTKEGVGGSARSNAEIAGVSMPVPYECRFLTETECGLWILDGKGWIIDYLGLGENYRGLVVPYTKESIGKPDDTWAYSPLLSLEKDKTYKLTFAARCLTLPYIESMKVCLGKDKTVAAQTQTITDVPEIPGKPADNENPENSLHHYDAEFSVAETGLYSMGFHCYSSADKKDFLQLTGIKVVETTGINNEPADNMKVYTWNGKLYLEGEYTSAVVYNQLGAVVYDIPVATGSINTHLVSGVYFVKIMNGNNASTYKIFIK